ncbi:MAG: AbgT family transporter [Lentimicrobiaceae bacterium]|nr:AbgT family transporter [Lentimicrobiaceae bacterium]
MSQKRKFPHTYVIIFYLILISAALTWVVPGGYFERETVVVNGTPREVVTEDSFTYAPGKPQTWQIFSAFFDGFVDRADIIVFILMIGGAFWIMNESKAIDVGIMAFLRKAEALNKVKIFRRLGTDNIIITLIILMFSIFGATFGMSEETIAFVIIFVPLSIKMGYDSIVGLYICYVAAALGFAGALLNPFTIGIAQGLSHLPLFSGIEYRLFCWVVINIVGIAFILRYMSRIKKRPERSLVYENDAYWRARQQESSEQVDYHRPLSAILTFIALGISGVIVAFLYPFTTLSVGNASVIWPVFPVLSAVFIVSGWLSLKKSVHFFILNLLSFTIILLIVGVMGYGWYVMEIATLFMALGILSGISMNYSPNRITTLFLDGVKDITSAALVVGLAGGIIIILQNGQVIDTLLHGMSGAMANLGNIATVGTMYLIQTGINIFIPSGSAKAALTMPIMSQFSDLIGLSRQATVMAFQFGDGFTNMITPTSGVLIGALGVARIPFDKWLRWITPLMIILIVLGFLLLIPTVTMKLNGF